MATRIAIYVITNIVNGKQYVGQTGDLKMRWYRHRNAKHPTSVLHSAIRLYGIDNFVFTHLMDVLSQEYANEIEQELIASKGTLAPGGYNLTAGGLGCFREQLPETRKKISESSKTRTHSPATRKKMSESQKGVVRKPLTDEHKLKLSKATFQYWKAKKESSKILNTIFTGKIHEI
jgi:group I intron endonuclease